MDIETWTSGYKVRAFEWIDGKNIYINVAYYRPGQSLSKPPEKERSVLLPKENENTIRNYLDSVVNAIMNCPESEFRNRWSAL